MEWLKKLTRQVFGSGDQEEPLSLGLADFQSGDSAARKPSISKPPSERSVHVAHPHNAPGHFYSENEGCITCGAPNAEAPALMAWYEESCGGNVDTHCIFRRQPQTQEEVEQAIRAMDVSCVENLRYRGTDPAILKRLCEMGKSHLCDALEQQGDGAL